MKNNCREFSLRLKEARKNKGISQYRLAKMLEIECASVCFWEQGRSYPRIDKLILISELLEVSIDWLLKGEKREEKENENEQARRSQERS